MFIYIYFVIFTKLIFFKEDARKIKKMKLDYVVYSP